MIRALIDGDWIIYAAGFAGQRTELVAPKFFRDETFKNITEMRSRVEGVKQTDVYSRFKLDPEAHFYHSAKCMIENNCQKIAEKFNEEVEPIVFVDGDGNFRSKLATIRPYKGQRGVHAKPLMFNDVRSYLLDAWKAHVVYDQESDDEMAICQSQYNAKGSKSVIVSVDKDMIQVPGWHLNPNKGFKNISKREGLERLYVQAIQGDPVDNIGGAYKYGAKKARAAINSKQNERQMWETVVDCYAKSIGDHGDRYGGLSAKQAALENMRLVYLRREVDEIWTPPGI